MTKWNRTRGIAVLSCVLVGVALALPPAGNAAPGGSDEIRNGTAKATAIVSRIAPGVGQLELGVTNGTAVTQVTNALAQASSQVLDFGLIGTSATSVDCEGDQTFKPEDLPQPTSVDNRDGDDSAARDEFSDSASPIGGGRMEVTAKQAVPESHAVTTTAAVRLAPAFELGSGKAEAISRVLPGEGREALASVETSIDLGGVFELRGMRWSAHHRTGLEPVAEAAFEIGRAELGGVPFPTEDLAALEGALNDLLVPSGITVTFPRVERLSDPTDLVRATPLRVEVRDSPAGKATVGPVLQLTRTQREQLFDDVVGLYCKSATALLVGDIAVSVVAGTGFLVIDIGGVEATSGDLVVGNPFGAPVVPPGGGAPVADAGGAAPDAIPSSGVGPAAPIAPDPVPGDVAAPVSAGSSTPLAEFCETIHPGRAPSCSRGSAWLVGLLGVIATAGVAGADLVRQRRRRDPATVTDEVAGS